VKFISIRWKIATALLGLGFGLVGSYVLLAKKTFEDDKISYIYETQQSQANLIAKSVSQQIEQTLQSTRNFLTAAISQVPGQSSSIQELFNSDKSLLAVRAHREGHSQQIEFEFRKPALAREIKFFPHSTEKGTPTLKQISPDQWQLDLPARGGPNSLAVSVIFPLKLDNEVLRLDQNLILADETLKPFSFREAPEILLQSSREKIRSERLASTYRLDLPDDSLLVSLSPLQLSPYAVALTSRESAVMAALNVLFKRSLFFIAFSLFFILFVAILISNTLTRNIQILTEDSKLVGQGHFEPTPPLPARDEIGVLSQVFQQMKIKIKDLLEETKDKARMEQELQTAKLVQESLFPKLSEIQVGTISLWGHFETFSECGGDWWYYFTRGEHLFIAIADATGHGTPSALVTSAARSTFSYLEETDLTLPEMMNIWNRAVRSCSNERVFMTAMLMRLNTRTGDYAFINACHEPPLLLTPEDGTHEVTPFEMEKNNRLGETRSRVWLPQSGQLTPGQKIVLFTDGLTGMENAEGKTLGEARAIKKIRKVADASQSARELGVGILEIYDNFRDGHHLVDDVTLICLAFSKVD